MTDAYRQYIGFHGTRLVRFLSDLAVSDAAYSHERFSERLGQLIDFGDSMRLSALHDRLRTLEVEPLPVSSETLREEVLRVRIALVQSVVESFVCSSGSARIKVPTLNKGVPFDQLTRFDPYHHFYLSHQRRFESKIQTLQLKVRDVLSNASTALARLVALDEAVRDTLSLPTRRYLAVIPMLLGKRFDVLLQEHRQCQTEPGLEVGAEQPAEVILKTWTGPTGWLNRFFQEMQGLLLAELELRLLPVLGLVDAVDEQVENTQ